MRKIKKTYGEMIMKKFITASLIALCSLVLIACSAIGGSQPEDVANSYIESAYQGDVDKMLAIIYIPKSDKDNGMQEIVTGKVKQAVAHAQEEADRKGGFKEVVVDSTNTDDANGTSTVHVTAKFKNEGSESKKHQVRLIRSDDKWKVKF